MKPNLMLKVASLLSLVFLTFHLAHDIVRGFEPGGLQNLAGGVLIAGVWLYAILMLSERRSGYIIMFLGSLLSIFVPYVHMKGRVSASPAGSAGPAATSFSSGRCSRSA